MASQPSQNARILAGEHQISPFLWALDIELRLQSGPFTSRGHAYQQAIMDCDHPTQSCKKAAQMGITDTAVIRTVKGHIEGRYPQGTMYLFPTDDDVSDFSKSRFNPLIDQNPLIAAHVQATDAVNIKRIGNGMLYLRGARSRRKIGTTKRTSSRLKSAPVDRLVMDERDEMDDDMIQLALERMSHSEIRETFALSTPSIPDFGIDKLYTQSDQRIWMIPCDACGTDTCLELEFLEDPERVIRTDPETGKGLRCCKKCGARIRTARGRWVAQYPNVSDHVGWWISQLNSIYWDPMEIRRMYESGQGLAEVMNSKLGQAYIEAENELTISQVLACCGTQSMRQLEQAAMEKRFPVAYGIDVQRDHLVFVMGIATSQKTRRIIKVARVPSWNDVHEILSRYNVKAGVVDLEPEVHKSREWQHGESHTVWLCDYSENQKTSVRQDEEQGVVVVRRTEFLDKSHALVNDMRLELPRRCPEIEEFARQVTAAVKTLKEDQVTGSRRYTYLRRGVDDYRHALSYFDLACEDRAMQGGNIHTGRASQTEIKDAYADWDPLGRNVHSEVWIA
jgi:phage terminase large subunit GpA-like protein